MDSDNEQLPTQYELTKIAAILSQSQDNSGSLIRSDVEQALKLWKDAGELLKNEASPFNEEEKARLQEVGDYSKAMRIDKQNLPQIPDKFFKVPNIAREEFLENVVGTSDLEIRMKWFRAYVKSEQSKFITLLASEEETELFYKSLADTVNSKEPIVYNEDDYDSVDRTDDIVTYLRKHSFSTEEAHLDELVVLNRSPYYHMKAYREWRMKMKDTTKEAPSPYLLSDCIAKATQSHKK